MTISFRPLDKWPYADAPTRRGYAYKADYSTIIADLEAELDALDAKDVMLSMMLTRKDIRRDGWPLASARPLHPGVILLVYTQTGELEFACDDNARWQHNLRAISLTLEALRAVDRHGATKRRQQYAGYLAAPNPADYRDPFGPAVSPSDWEAVGSTRTAQEAWDFLSEQSGLPPELMRDDPDALRTGTRLAKKRCHPDTGGSDAQFRRLTAALEALGLT
ncbi:MAG: hypothetical protein JO250_09220 [Armatimonadetes bacterium]|nr:hypothetical protein [Armatimonadota bacterium]